jgi:16S rRNA G966 N2-methylase RsmD
MFNGHYIDWRTKRISKILEIYNKEFFNNKNILELGCGYGDIGKEFISFGADVTFAEGRSSHCKILKEKFPTSEIINLNQNAAWDLEKRFDIVIHWGVLYHLTDWKSDLISTLKHSDLIFLESEVSNSDDVNFDLKITEKNEYDQALNGIGSRPSAANVELFIKELGFNIERFDDEILDSKSHQYSWKVTNTNTWQHGLRRFWIVKK